MANIHFDFRRGGGAGTEILYGEVSIRPTTSFARGTSLVVPANTTLDLVDGEATLANVAATPAPVEGSIEWAYVVKVTDRLGKSFEWMVGVPDTPDTVEFASLPRYYETKPPLFGQGPQGVPGESATVAVGTVTSGSTAQVSNSGTNTDAVLNFTLPKGDKGDPGPGVPAGGTALQYIRKNSGNTTTEWATLNKAAVGLSNVDNTSDANKPVSLAQEVFVQENADTTKAEIVDLLDAETSNNIIAEDSDTRSKLDSLYLQKDFWGISVKDFGAVGDGITDDTTAIKNALAAVPFSRSGAVHFEKKTYYMSHQAVLKSNTTIYGNGATLLKKSPTDNSYVFFSMKSYGALGYGAGGENVTVRDLIFRGKFNPDVSQGRRACGFGLHHAKNVLVENCHFIETQGRGHTFDLNGCDGVTIRNCTFQGFQVEGSALAAAECIQLDQSKNGSLSAPEDAADLPYDGLLTRNVIIEGNRFLPLTVNGVDYPCPNPLGNHTVREGQWYENIWFTNNLIVDPHEDTTSNFAGSEYNGNIHLIGTRGVKITGNTWMSTTGGKAVRCIAVYGETKGNPVGQDPNIVQSVTTIPAQSPRDILIQGNSFIGFTGTSLAANAPIYVLGLSASLVDDLRIVGNTFKDNGTTGTVIANAVVEYANNPIIEGNNSKNSRRFLTIRNSANARVVGNGIDTSTSYPIFASGCSSLIVSGNQLRNHTQGIRVETSEVVNVVNNQLSNATSNSVEIILVSTQGFTVTGNAGKSINGGSSFIQLTSSCQLGTVTANISSGYSNIVNNQSSDPNISINSNSSRA